MSIFRNRILMGTGESSDPLEEIKDHYGSIYKTKNLDEMIETSPDKDKLLALYPYHIINKLGGGDRRFYGSNYPIFAISNGWGVSLVMYVENYEEEPYVAYGAVGSNVILEKDISTTKISTNAQQKTEHWWDIKITCYGFMNPGEDIYWWKS